MCVCVCVGGGMRNAPARGPTLTISMGLLACVRMCMRAVVGIIISDSGRVPGVMGSNFSQSLISYGNTSVMATY